MIRALFALVLADIADLEWPSEFASSLAPEGAQLAKLPFGSRIALLDAALKIHEGRDDRVLPNVAAWWRDARRAASLIVRERNLVAHGSSLTEDTPDEARERLASFLNSATWLQEIQLLYIENVAREYGRNNGVVRRLRGGKPFATLAHFRRATWSMELQGERVYTGSADGTRWTLNPFFDVEGDHVLVLDGIGRDGTLRLADPEARDIDAPRKVVPGIPDLASQGRLVPWTESFDTRQKVTRGWRAVEERPDLHLRVPLNPDATLRNGSEVGHFRLIRKRGEGGFATVWEVEDLHTSERFALKILKREDEVSAHDGGLWKERFKQECALLKKHATVPRVVRPVESFTLQVGDGFRAALRMPLLERSIGEHAAMLRASGFASEEAILRWGVQTLETLEALHARGVVHRDVKPSNLMLDAHGSVIVTDLGIASDREAQDRLTQSDMTIGSLRYMAPEQHAASRDIDGRADVFALAKTLHELFTGKVPEVAGKGIPGEFGELLRRMGQQDRDQRPGAAEARQILASILARHGQCEVEGSSAECPIITPLEAGAPALETADEEDAATAEMVPATDRGPTGERARVGETDSAIADRRAALARDPTDAEAIAAMFDLYREIGDRDKAWCLAATATFLSGERTRADMRAFCERHRPARPPRCSTRLGEEDWTAKLLHPDEDPGISGIFAAIVDSLRRVKTLPLACFEVSHDEREDSEVSRVAGVRSLETAADALGLPRPVVILRPQQAGGLGFVPSDPVASVAGPAVLASLRPEELAFVAARHMSFYRADHYVRVLSPTARELMTLLLAAIRIVRPDQDVPPGVLQTAQQLAPFINSIPNAIERLREGVRAALDQSAALDVQRWSRAVELTGVRAGFLLCGDLEVARRMISMEPGLPNDPSTDQRIEEVVRFSISDGYFDLRKALGINLPSTAS